MHLYTYGRAPNPQRVAHLLKYKNIEIESTEFDLATGGHFNSQFKSINPDCTVPTLVLDNGIVLSDTIAICAYLDRLYPQKPLFGNDDCEYAQIIGWSHRIFLEGFMAVAEILRNKSEAFKDRALPGRIPVKQIPELIERGSSRLTSFWHSVNEYLTHRTFMVGDALSMADIDLYVVIGFSGWVKMKPSEEYVALHRWFEQITAILDN